MIETDISTALVVLAVWTAFVWLHGWVSGVRQSEGRRQGFPEHDWR